MTFPVLSAGTSAYNLQRSLRFRSSATAYLNRTPASASNRTTWTWSGWFKRGTFANNYSTLFSAGADVNNFNELRFTDLSSGVFDFTFVTGGVDTARITTTPVYRDPSAWYHVVVALDTTQATAANRVKIYVNGVQVTSLTTATYPTQNSTWYVNAANAHGLGATVAVGRYFDGYMTEVNFIDGQALTPSSFGSTNAVTGVWQPAKYTGTYGTNGFYLPFTNLTSTSTLGNDFSGNSNNWTTNNISLTSGVTYDSMTDVPTLTSPTAGNFAVLNPLDIRYGIANANALTSGNLQATAPAANQGLSQSSIFFTSGKWYMEMTVASVSSAPSAQYIAYRDASGNIGYYAANGSVGGVSGSSGASYTTNDVIGMAVDKDTGTIEFFKNGTTQGGSRTLSANAAGNSFLQVSNYNSSVVHANFGQRPFTYTPPSGFVALNTFNLPSSTIPAGNKFMDATLYTGTGSSLSVTNSGAMQPDWVWIKSRSAATDHALYDVLRGTQSRLESNTTDAQVTSDNGVTAFGTGGFTVGTLAQVNTSAATYVGWQWKANGAGVTNTAGSITSTVSANTTSGFSVVTYTANGTNGATVGHGLNVTPAIYIVKRRNTTGNWVVVPGNSSLFGGSFYLQLNTTSAVISNSDVFTSYPGPSVFYLSTNADVNASGGTYVAYCIAQIAGFSAVGKYTGNGSTDGPFIYTGFRPRWILIKENADRNWQLIDSARLGYNGATNPLAPNTSGAEPGAADRVDFLSNGFKPRVSAADFNSSGGTYIYAAFAENPFKNALAR